MITLDANGVWCIFLMMAMVYQAIVPQFIDYVMIPEIEEALKSGSCDDGWWAPF